MTTANMRRASRASRRPSFPTADDPDAASPQPAGDFGSWLTGLGHAIRGDRESDVPCGSCTACCTSSQFIHIGPDERDTLAQIPKALLFRAPGLPRGHVLMGYDERGHCPMLVEERCTIYEHRPRTCRTYDCRIFPAAGVELDGEDKIRITLQARRWRFEFATDTDRVRLAAVRAAVTYLETHRGELSEGAVPRNETALAVLAVEVHEAFLRYDAKTGACSLIEPDLRVMDSAVRERTRT